MFNLSARSGINRAYWILAALLGLALLTACTKQTVVPGPTQAPPGPAVDLNATATALDVAVTQVANSQATLVAQARDLSATEAVQATAAAATGPAGAAPTTQAASATASPAADTPVPTTAATLAPASTQAPEPTHTPPPTSSAPCTSVHPALAPILEAAGAAGLNPGCPVAAGANVQGAVQEYWANAQNPDPSAHLRSLLLWRGDTKEIYVLRGADTEARQAQFSVYTDRWQEGDPAVAPACANVQVPGGYQMPVRGFARVWCNNGLASVIGWPNRQEVAADLLVQPARNGVLLQVSAPDAGLGYLVALDYGSGRAITRAITP